MVDGAWNMWTVEEAGRWDEKVDMSLAWTTQRCRKRSSIIDSIRAY